MKNCPLSNSIGLRASGRCTPLPDHSIQSVLEERGGAVICIGELSFNCGSSAGALKLGLTCKLPGCSVTVSGARLFQR